jgi:CelD/BcsL family acetyltransferase involved in cellulose biosynthesis
MPWQLLPRAEFGRHAAEWDRLQRASTNTPFLEADFIAPALDEFGNGRELLALHRRATELDMAAIVRPAGRGKWETFQPSQLPLGAWVAAADMPIEERAGALLRALPGFALGLGLTQLDPKLHPRPAAAPALGTMDFLSTSCIDVAGPFDAYWETRGKNLKQNCRKQRNKLQTEGIEPQLECVTEAADVAAALADYGALESAGWKAGTGTAIHPDNAQGRFYRRMLENFCARGHGRIYRYRFGDKVVAMDLCIDNGPLVVILKTAYDESYRTVSPSTLMRHDQFKLWWDEGRYRRIEFYGKTMEWHTRWTDDHRMLFHANAYRWPLVRRLAEARAARAAAAATATATATATAATAEAAAPPPPPKASAA